MLFTVMIPAVLDRLGSPLLEQLRKQIFLLPEDRREEVEVLALYDNRKRSTGLKRQALLDAAQGDFVACLDDDDGVSIDYLDQITAAIRAQPDVDVIVFNDLSTLNGENCFVVRCGLEYENEGAHKENDRWVDIRRKPWHWCAWNARLAKAAKFPDGYIDDDWYWCRQMVAQAKTQHRIDKVLHHYQFDSKTTLSQQGKSTL